MVALISFIKEKETNIDIEGRRKNGWSYPVQGISGMKSLNKQEEMGFIYHWKDCLQTEIKL